jgi:hypothetical protein
VEQSDTDDKSYIRYVAGSADSCAFDDPASYDNKLYKAKKDQRQMGNVYLQFCAVSYLRLLYDNASIAVRGVF